MKSKITQFLLKEYNPTVIVLGGSRARGEEQNRSDWDIFLFGSQKQPSQFLEFEGQTLDLTFHEWPQPKDYIFKIPFGPVWPNTVLYDASEGEFAQVLKKTLAVYNQGPRNAYPEGCAQRLTKLKRWKHKMEVYVKREEVQFYYVGYVYELALRVWFEQQNLWPLTPVKAIPYIQERDTEFYQHLQSLIHRSPSDKVKAVEGIIEKI